MSSARTQKISSTEKIPSIWNDIRLIFATILTDPGSSLAYGADALIAVTVVLMARSETYNLGVLATILGGAIIMSVYLLAILVYNGMTRHHTHRILGGGAFVSALITSNRVRNPTLKKLLYFLGKSGTASLLSDFPATQAISIIAGVEALYFIPVNERLYWAFGIILFLSLIQRYGLGNLSRYMIWPVLLFYAGNICINLFGIYQVLDVGWQPPEIPENIRTDITALFWPVLLISVANGSTLITGVEVGYSSVNIPHHRGRAIRRAMWILYGIVVVTYSMQLVNFLGLGIRYDSHIPVPLQIARFLGGDALATPFGIVTAIMLLLAAQTAQTDFPLEILRASRSNFFPKAIGDSSWRKTRPAPVIGGHEGLYNPRATVLLGVLSCVILVFFPSSHGIESMYGLAVISAMNIDIASFLIRQLRVRKYSLLTILGMIIMSGMLGNILYNKFFEGAWFIVLMMFLYLFVFLMSEEVYKIWHDKLKIVPLEFGLWYPAFQGKEVDRKNIILVSIFHPGVILFLKRHLKSGRIPLAVHFQTDPVENIPDPLPEWYENIRVPQGMDTITAITRYISKNKPERVHLIPLLVSGLGALQKYYFANSIESLKYTLSEITNLQVEYNQERVVIRGKDLLRRVFSFIPWRKKRD